MPDTGETPFDVLGIAPDSDGTVIEAAYWRRAKELAGARMYDPGAAAEIERLNEAYRFLMSPAGMPRYRRPATTRQRRWFKRTARAGLFVSVALAAATAGLSFRTEIVDLSDQSRARAEDLAKDAQDWIDSLDSTPIPAQFYTVANTGGQGAWVRVAPGYDAAGVVVLPDGAGVAGLGEEQVVAYETWVRVRDGQGREGWISNRWLAAP
ncbi:MAG: hypothetical protein WEC75_09205 [Dehalococcoidia bacterium]